MAWPHGTASEKAGVGSLGALLNQWGAVVSGSFQKAGRQELANAEGNAGHGCRVLCGVFLNKGDSSQGVLVWCRHAIITVRRGRVLAVSSIVMRRSCKVGEASKERTSSTALSNRACWLALIAGISLRLTMWRSAYLRYWAHYLTLICMIQ